MGRILWTPSAGRIAAANLTRFDPRPYPELHAASVADPGAFWRKVWHFAEVIGDPGATAYVPGASFRDAAWFPEAKLNFAENLLRDPDDTPAVLAIDERGAERMLSRRELFAQATAFAATLTRLGVGVGDRVAAVLPNGPDAVVAMLGTTAVGAAWSCCSPDFGPDAVRSRFAQIAPRVVVTAAECQYAGKRVVPHLPRLPGDPVRLVVGEASYADAISTTPTSFTFPRFGFDQPAYILYSSGTTGVPKGIVHGAGGTLLQHAKELLLHCDVRPGDRVFFYTTTGWMMWNWLVGALACRACVVLYDGSPFHPNPGTLFALAEKHNFTHFGAGSRYYAALEKAGETPRTTRNLDALRCLLATGSPLLPENFDYLYRDVKPDVCVASISGGTDIVSCFLLGVPTLPVRRGELTAKGLGMDVRIVDDAGNAVVGTPGELVCATPFPSRPVGFWNDPDDSKYAAAYFERFPGVWCHGDWAEETPEGGFVIHGRSDATLNPGGVRIGTAELYEQLEAFPEVSESLATVVRADGDERIVLFVRLRPGTELSAELAAGIRHKLRANCSPRHVPRWIAAAPDLPRTLSGKLSELAVRNVLNGLPATNAAALANPDSLEFFRRPISEFGAV